MIGAFGGDIKDVDAGHTVDAVDVGMAVNEGDAGHECM